jgi:hypothetical protein
MKTTDLRELVKNALSSYSGGAFDRLSLEGKVLTAIAWDNYPDKSFENLVEEVRSISNELAEIISKEGISFEILGEGDRYKASGYRSPYVWCDTEEWYADIHKFKRIWEDWEEKDRERLSTALENFEGNVVKEVRLFLTGKGHSFGSFHNEIITIKEKESV